jgi:S1-C subfamily serine protease
MTTTTTSPIATRHRRLNAILVRLTAFLMMASMLVPLIGSPAPAAAAQGESLPENVLQASVRVQIIIEVTPEDRDEVPFPCNLRDGTPLEVSNGSGTLITEDGYILTNHHVATMEENIPREVISYCEDQADGDAEADWGLRVWTPDERGVPEEAYQVEVVADSSMADDMAVLKITEKADGSRVNTRRNPFPYVQFGDSDALREPERITLIGYPANAGPNRRVSEGIFSGWGDNGYGVEWIYTDATISGGNSGGTAVNSEGLFIGIPSAGTFSDCRPGDTNNDGQINEDDSGCIGLGGNYGLIVPGNTAREFAEEATGLEFDVVESSTPVEDETPTPEVEETEEPVDPSAPPVGDIEFFAYDENLEPQDAFHNASRIEGCFENLNLTEGDEGTATWYLDGEVFIVSEFVWDDAWNPQACASVYTTEESESPYLDPGTYTLEVTVNGQTVTSDELEVTRSTQVESVTISGRNSDRETIKAVDGVLEGEITTVYVDIAFIDMNRGDAWQVDLYLDGELIESSDAEAWANGATGEESVRLRTAERGPFEPGAYEIVITINEVEAERVPLEIAG